MGTFEEIFESEPNFEDVHGTINNPTEIWDNQGPLDI